MINVECSIEHRKLRIEHSMETRDTRHASRFTRVEQDRWLQLAVRALARSDRTTAQIEGLLAAKGAPPSQIRAAVLRLKSLRYLDDVAFASRWAERRLARMPMGRARLQEELLATGCPEYIVHATVRAAYRAVSEGELAAQLARAAGRASSARKIGRLARLLSQRGFDEDTIETALGMFNDQC